MLLPHYTRRLMDDDDNRPWYPGACAWLLYTSLALLLAILAVLLRIARLI